jgi:hypothetical protein
MPDPTMTTPSELFTHPRPRCIVTTVYSDPAVSLTVQAWRRELCSYYLLFRIANQYSLTLNETAVFYFFPQISRLVYSASRRLGQAHLEPRHR